MTHAVHLLTIASAPLQSLDAIVRAVSHAYLRNELSEADAGLLYEAAHERRRELTWGLGRTRFSGLPPQSPQPDPARHRAQRSHDRQASIWRRRACASCGALPPQIATRFTESERAALAILVEEVSQHGRCDRSIAEIAARAGVSITTTKTALRHAAHERLITITLRPRKGQKNLTNLVEIACETWRSWIAKRPRAIRGIGDKPLPPTDNPISKKGRVRVKQHPLSARFPAQSPWTEPFRRRS